MLQISMIPRQPNTSGDTATPIVENSGAGQVVYTARSDEENVSFSIVDKTNPDSVMQI